MQTNDHNTDQNIGHSEGRRSNCGRPANFENCTLMTLFVRLAACQLAFSYSLDITKQD